MIDSSAASAPPEHVVLVDEHDREIGRAEKLEAHRTGRLHRAFSVFVFNDVGELLLQRRAAGKYHSGGLWSNTCCGHPRPDTTVRAEAERRLREEMGLECELEARFVFQYRSEVGPELIEHELDHVLTGHTAVAPRLNPAEADAYRWAAPRELLVAIAAEARLYTAWFPLALRRLLAEPELAERLAAERRR